MELDLSHLQKTVTYVLGTFVTLVSGPNTPFQRGWAVGPGDFGRCSYSDESRNSKNLSKRLSEAEV